MGRTGSCSVFGLVRFCDVRVLENDSEDSWLGCSGLVDSAMSYCDGSDKVDFVEKMWRSLRKSLWVNCGKVLHRAVDKSVLHILGKRFTRFGEFCGKFYNGFAHRFNRGKSGVLHIFHIAYYYNY